MRDKYRLKEMPTGSFSARAGQNVMDSDGALLQLEWVMQLPIEKGIITGEEFYGKVKTRQIDNEGRRWASS